MNYKLFSERLNKELDDIGVPERAEERVEVFAKLIKAPRFKAESILNGNLCPEPALLESLANDLEVSVDWLLGKSEKH